MKLSEGRPEFGRLEQAIEDKQIAARPSNHVGPSSLGDPCPRAVWYNYRNYTRKTFSPRVLRLFGRGHREEPIVIKDLKSVGITILSTQEKAVFAAGHGNAYSDGRIIGDPDAPKTEHLLEIKTANTKNFNQFKKHGVEHTNIKYWVQIHCYMNLFGLKRCRYIVVNKETDKRLYLRYKYNPTVAKIALNRAIDIINAKVPPKGITGGATYQCRWCDHVGVCKQDATPQKTCRSCRHLEPIPTGLWNCDRKAKIISFKKQQKACKKYSCIPRQLK